MIMILIMLWLSFIVIISYPGLVQFLLNSGADIQETDNEDNTPLHKVFIPYSIFNIPKWADW